MRLLQLIGCLAVFSAMVSAETLPIVGPESRQPDLRWQVVNDTVMGGKSSSRFEVRGGAMHFSGFLNTDGGGFASLRSQRLDVDLGRSTRVRLRVKGDGRTYSIRLYSEGERVSYQHSFQTIQGQWQVVELNIRDFYASWRGRRFERPPLTAAKIDGLGVILADGLDGPFELVMDRFEFDADGPQRMRLST